MKLKVATVLLCGRLALFVSGFFVTLGYLELPQGGFPVKADGTFELSWFLENSGKIKGGFKVEGGNRQVNLNVRDPYVEFICNWTATNVD